MADAPSKTPEPVTETKSDKPETKAEAKAAAKAEKPVLARASEATDPAVHHAMAVLDGALMNRAALDVAAGDIAAADKQVDAARKALAELGYE